MVRVWLLTLYCMSPDCPERTRKQEVGEFPSQTQCVIVGQHDARNLHNQYNNARVEYSCRHVPTTAEQPYNPRRRP